MSTAADSGETRQRGAGFPVLPLREAVDAVVQAGQHGRDHSQNAFAAYLGHSTVNSGAYKNKLAALRDWGLVERGKDRIVLSDLARRFTRLAPDHLQAYELLAEAFKQCSIFAQLYEDSARGTPLDRDRLKTTAVLDLSVNRDQADRFIESFVASATSAGLARSLEGQKIELLHEAPQVAEVSGEDARAQEADAAPRVEVTRDEPLSESAGVRQQATKPSVPDALHQVWSTDDGEVVFIIRSANPLPAEAYGAIGEIVTKSAQLAKLLSSPVAEQG